MRAGLLLLVASLVVLPAYTRADSQSKQQLLNQMNSYIRAASNNADGMGVSVAGLAGSIESPPEPEWYGGNLLGAIELGKDMFVNLFNDFPSGFLDCFDFEHSCDKRIFGVCVRWNVSYRWPVQQILSHTFWQHRYLPPAYFTALKASGYYDNIFNPAVQDLHAPLALIHASVDLANNMNKKSWAAYIPGHKLLLPKIDMPDSEIPLDAFDERYRFSGGKIGNTTDNNSNQIEYSLGPSLAQIAWFVIMNYFPFLRVLPCLPPEQIPPPFSSQDPGLIDVTRDPYLGYMYYKDKELQADIVAWLKNPAICQEWMMMKNHPNIPHNLIEWEGNLSENLRNPLGALLDLTTDNIRDLERRKNKYGGMLAPLVPRSRSEIAQLDRMCTQRWGGSIPFTTVNQLHETPFIDAGKNFEKSIRLGVAMYKTFIEGTSAAQYTRWYRFLKTSKGSTSDAYQLTYPDKWQCNTVGTPGEKFPGAYAHPNVGDHGLYSMTHWLRVGGTRRGFLNSANSRRCRLGLGDLPRVLEGLAQYGF